MTLQPITSNIQSFLVIWCVVSKVKNIENFYIIVIADIAQSVSELS